MTILHVDSSITGEQSASRTLTRSLVDQLRSSQPDAEIIYRDLAASPLPHLTLDAFADTTVLEEFLGADTVVIGAPMYNFTLPTQLKAWIDSTWSIAQVARPQIGFWSDCPSSVSA